ncbi:hypothetical protein MBLNU457_5468t1 [Dothideomycetes sp. NU457]
MPSQQPSGIHMMPPTHRKPDPQVSLFDVFIGKGRTIRSSKPPGFPVLSLSPTSKQDDSKNKANDVKKLKSLDAKKDGGKENDSKDAQHWTPAQDAKLLEMKAAKKPWKDIETEIGKPKKIAQPRFKELQGQGKAATGAEQGKDKNATNHEQKVAEKKKKKWEAMANAKKEDQGKKDKSNQEKTVKADRAKAGAEKKYTLAQLSKVEDRNFSIRELAIIADLVVRLDVKEKAMWEVVASRYFDRTGCRVDGEDLKERFKELDRA